MTDKFKNTILAFSLVLGFTSTQAQMQGDLNVKAYAGFDSVNKKLNDLIEKIISTYNRLYIS